MNRASALDKQCQLIEARAGEAKREAEESISNLKLKAKAEGELVRNMDSGSDHRGWVAGETRQR